MERIDVLHLYLGAWLFIIGAVMLTAGLFNLVHSRDVTSCAVDDVVNPNPRFIYSGDGWMLDLKKNQSVTMSEALKRVRNDNNNHYQ